MGTDKNADVPWVGDSWGANLARIDTHNPALGAVVDVGCVLTNAEVGEEAVLKPYSVAVDSRIGGLGDVWMRLIALYALAALRPQVRVSICVVPALLAGPRSGGPVARFVTCRSRYAVPVAAGDSTIARHLGEHR